MVSAAAGRGIALLAAILAGCSGKVAGRPPEPAPEPPPGGAADDQPGPAVFRRLTRVEYDNTVRDLLGDSSSPAAVFPPDTDAGTSGFARGGSVAAVDAGRLLEASEALAAAAVSRRLPSLLPCNPADDEEGCARQFIARFGRRAYRRPLADDETRQLQAYYADQRALPGHGFSDAIRMVITAMLMSPKFLYHWELAPGAAVRDGAFVRYNPHELASRLSYLIYASMPDEPLFAAADAGALATPADIEGQARRMLRDPRARDAVADFFVQWLGIGGLPDLLKDPARFPDYDARAMIAETRTFTADLMAGGDGKLTTLLTAPPTAPALARLYDGTPRAGVLTQASFLAAHATAADSHPVKRGKAIADRLLCQDLPLPPDNVPDPRPPADDLPTRQRFAEHGASACAIACHAIIDPLGFAFEGYDAVGGFRTSDGGQPVDASGTVLLGGQAHPFANAIELVGLLARSDEVPACMGRQWLRFALRRQEGDGDGASLAAAQQAFRSSGLDMRELVVALTRTHAFTHRAPSPGEVLP